MSASQRIAFAVAASWLNRAVTILSKLFLLPILFRYMGKEELGIWFLLGDSQGLLGLLGLGIAPTLTRHIALAKGRSGAEPNVEISEKSQRHIADLVVTGRIIFCWLAVAIFLISCVVGYSFIEQIQLNNVNRQIVVWSWIVMCIGFAVGIWASYLECWLTGIGYVGWDSLIVTVTNNLAILTSIAAVMMGGGLLALAATSVIFGLVQRFVMLRFIRWRSSEIYQIKGSWNRKYFQAMIQPALYAWLTNLGAYLILRTDSYFIAVFRGTGDVPAYAATYQLILNIFVLASSFAMASPTFISQAWQSGDLKTIHLLIFKNAKLGLSLMAAGTAFIMMAGKELISLWLGSENFIGYHILLIFCIMLTLELQHVILAVSARATEDEKYVIWAIAAGILNLAFTWYFIQNFGLFGVAIGTMLAQLLTNNWYQVYRPIIRLKLNFIVYLRQVVFLWTAVLVCSLGLSQLGKQLLAFLEITSDWYQVVVAGLICSSVFAIAFWQAILESSHREYVKTKAKTFIAGCLWAR